MVVGFDSLVKGDSNGKVYRLSSDTPSDEEINNLTDKNINCGLISNLSRLPNPDFGLECLV